MGKSNQEIVVVKGKKAWYALLFPFACFCIALGILWNGFEVLTSEMDIRFIEVALAWSFAAFLFVILGTVFGMVQDYHFDFKRKRYKIVKRIGVLGMGRWRQFQNLEYVSVFENPDGRFEINLWYNSNKHFFIDSYFYSKAAIKYATRIAKELKIEFHNGITNQRFVIEDDTASPVLKANRKIDAHFSQGNRPLWHTIIAGLCFSISLIVLYGMFFEISIYNHTYKLPFSSIEMIMLLMLTGIRFSMVHDYLFDLQNKQFKVIYNVGFVKWGKWKNLKTIDYISVFQKKEGQFQINLWYNTNKRIFISSSNTYDTALEIGKKLAIKLNIDLLDASDPHNSEWVELS